MGLRTVPATSVLNPTLELFMQTKDHEATYARKRWGERDRVSRFEEPIYSRGYGSSVPPDPKLTTSYNAQAWSASTQTPKLLTLTATHPLVKLPGSPAIARLQVQREGTHGLQKGMERRRGWFRQDG